LEENLLQKLLAAVTGRQQDIIPTVTGDYVSGDVIQPINPRPGTPAMQRLNSGRARNVAVTGNIDEATKAVQDAVKNTTTPKSIFSARAGKGPLNRLAFDNQFQNALKGFPNNLVLGDVDVAGARKAGIRFNPATKQLIMPKGMNQVNIPRVGGIGKLGGVLLVADALAELADKNDPMIVNLAEGTGRAGGGLLGAVLGGAAAGTLAGGPIGTLAGGIGGAFLGSGLGQTAARGLTEVLLPDGYVRDYRQGRMLDEIGRQNELQAAMNANQTSAAIANALIESSLARR
jgi:hypothetical protein